MSLNEVAKISGIALSKIYDISHIPYNIDSNIPLREIKYLVSGFETDMVKVAIDHYLIEGEASFKCPYGVAKDPYPGLCAFYDDYDNDGHCDYELNEFI